eukprot:1161331-Pelagomonas_calceolata.AAC.10
MSEANCRAHETKPYRDSGCRLEMDLQTSKAHKCKMQLVDLTMSKMQTCTTGSSRTCRYTNAQTAVSGNTQMQSSIVSWISYANAIV